MTISRKNIRTISYRTWAKFIANFVSDLCGTETLPPNQFLFRGQGDIDYKLISSFDRNFKEITPPERVIKYEEIKLEFKKLYEKRYGKNHSEALIKSSSQHYGLPTRMLDWTENPFVAAYFAFNKAALDNQKNGKVAIWSINKKSALIHPNLGLIISPAEIDGNIRADAQTGYFSELTGSFNSLEDYVEAFDDHTEPTLIRFSIPVSEAKKAFSFLDMLGFNAYSIFPDMQGIITSTLENHWLKSTFK